MTEDLGEEEEGLLVADLDFNEILKVKAMLTCTGIIVGWICFG